MKFKDSRIFSGDIYKVVEPKTNLNTGDGVEISSFQKGYLKSKNTVLLKMNEKYVPIYYVHNIFTYISLAIKSKQGKFDGRFLDVLLNSNTEKCVDNIKPLFDHPTTVSLKVLQEIQKEQNYNDYSQRGFECF